MHSNNYQILLFVRIAELWFATQILNLTFFLFLTFFICNNQRSVEKNAHLVKPNLSRGIDIERQMRR